MIKTVVFTLAVPLLALAVVSQVRSQDGGIPVGKPDPSPRALARLRTSPILDWDGISPLPRTTHVFGIGLDSPRDGIRKLPNLCDRAATVVDVIVEASFPSVKLLPNSWYLETDKILRVSRQFKGEPVKAFVIAAPGGVVGEFTQTIVGIPLLDVGSRYVLFINLEKRSPNLFQDRGGIPRYELWGAGGVLPISTSGSVHFLGEDNPMFRNQYEGATIQMLEADITRACAQPVALPAGK